MVLPRYKTWSMTQRYTSVFSSPPKLNRIVKCQAIKPKSHSNKRKSVRKFRNHMSESIAMTLFNNIDPLGVDGYLVYEEMPTYEDYSVNNSVNISRIMPLQSMPRALHESDFFENDPFEIFYNHLCVR